LINGGFETGNFSGWQTIGETLVVDSSIGTPPAGGTFQALITNAPSCGCLGELHPGTYSGTPSVNELNDWGPLETFLGLPKFSLLQFSNALGLNAVHEGSAIEQTFNANTGSILNFQLELLVTQRY
jgi:hypothetical protein